MSELRDMAAALKSISDSLTSIESCMAETVANGVQLREGMHDLRNKLQVELLDKGKTERSVEVIQAWLGDFGKKLGELTDDVSNWRSRFEQLADDVTQGFRRDRAAIRSLRGDDDETTQA